MDNIERDREASRYIVLSPEQLEDDEAIEAIESTPAYNRDKRLVDELRRDRHIPPSRHNEPSTPATSSTASPGSGNVTTPAPDPSQSKVISFDND